MISGLDRPRDIYADRNKKPGRWGRPMIRRCKTCNERKMIDSFVSKSGSSVFKECWECRSARLRWTKSHDKPKPIPPPDGLMVCTGCGEEKLVRAFYIRKAYVGRDGSKYRTRPRRRCVACQRAYQDNWAKNHPDRLALYTERHRANGSLFLWSRAKSRSKARGVHFDLRPEDVVVPDMCPALGIPLSLKPAKSKEERDHVASLDRIDPSLGYVSGNVAVISNRANRIKNDATLEELEKITAWLREATRPRP